MKLERGAITILFDRDYVEIKIHDRKANTLFTSIELTSEQFTRALSRESYTPCEINVMELDKVGKTHENKKHEFELIDCSKYKSQDKIFELAKETCPKGWEPDNYFNSQDSFFKKDGKDYARCTIRRWI